MWKQIEEMNWNKYRNEARGYNTARDILLKTTSQETCEKLREFAGARAQDIETRIAGFEQEHNMVFGCLGGDDSYSDLRYHIVGMGESVYNEIMNNPNLIRLVEPVESFIYCFPYDDDFKLLSGEHHIERAIKSITALANIVAMNAPGYEDILTIKDMMDRFLFMYVGDFNEATRGYNENIALRYTDFDSNEYHAMFANYINDCKRYMTDSE